MVQAGSIVTRSPARLGVSLSLDPTLDPAAMRGVFNGAGRIHIPGVFAPGCAEAVHRSLERETPWERTLNSGAKNLMFPVEVWAAQPAEARAPVEDAIQTQARTGFQYVYDSYNTTLAVRHGRRLGIAAEAVHDFVNARPFLDFLRALTGDARIAACDSQASRYTSGQFLTQHTDHVDGVARLYAYVLNFTPAWKVDWGGLLAFIDGDGHVAEAYTPRFNALNLFRVPQAHCVTQVSTFAGAPRYAITGWVLARA